MPAMYDVSNPAQPSWLCAGVLRGYTFFVLPFLGGFATAWFLYEVLEFSFGSSLLCWLAIAVVAIRIRHYALFRTYRFTWWGVFVIVWFMALLALLPVLAYVAIYLPVHHLSTFPAMIPALAIAVFVGYMIDSFARAHLMRRRREHPDDTERGRREGGVYQANEAVIQNELRKEQIRQANKEMGQSR